MKRLLLAAATLVLTGCEYTEVPREIGYKGKARLDPWLAAERFAGCLGRQVRPVISWTEPQPGDAVWILPASVLGNLSFTNRVERWMEKGGHLILLVEHADQESSDWAEDQPLPIGSAKRPSKWKRGRWRPWHGPAANPACSRRGRSAPAA